MQWYSAREHAPRGLRLNGEYLCLQAAIRAGYSKKTAAIIGFENLIKPNIADAIAKAQSKRSERTEITRQLSYPVIPDNWSQWQVLNCDR